MAPSLGHCGPSAANKPSGPVANSRAQPLASAGSGGMRRPARKVVGADAPTPSPSSSHPFGGSVRRRRGSAPLSCALPWRSGEVGGEEEEERACWWSAPQRRVFSALAGACVAVTAALHHPAAASAETLRLSASENPEIFEAQKTLVQSWSIVRDAFVDSSKEGFARKWEGELASALARTAQDDASNDVEAAYGEIGSMLRTIGDPYTRFVNAKEFEDFSLKNDGELQGVGLLIASEPDSGRLLVLSPIDGSPAAKAGILPGDEIAYINGRPTRGQIDGEMASAILRGRHGTSVTVKLARRTEQIPGVPGRPASRGQAPEVKWRQVKLVRDDILLSPVYSELLTSPAEVKGREQLVTRTGYIKLTAFNQRAAAEVAKAIEDLRDQGAEGFILDLRDNPGGLVNEGLDIASLWLQPNTTLLHTMNNNGSLTTVKLPESATPLDGDDPLVVVVNKRTASASEILAGALKDNKRARLIGAESSTFGKGKIQSVFELGQGGSGGALFVTVAKYQTPSHRNIDAVGITPDKICEPFLQTASSSSATKTSGGNFAGTDVYTADIQSDPCIKEAEKALGTSNINQ